VWTEEYRDSNFIQMMADAGLTVREDAPTLAPQFWNGVMGVKPA